MASIMTVSSQQIESIIISYLHRTGYTTNDETRRLIREELDNHDFKASLFKLLETMSLNEKIKNVAYAEINKMLPAIIKSHLQTATPGIIRNEMEQLFPKYLDSNPAVQQEIRKHLISINRIVSDE